MLIARSSRRPLSAALAASLAIGLMTLLPATPAAALDPDLAQFGTGSR